MTTELVLLIVSTTVIMGLFFNKGLTGNFHNNLPYLSARLEQNVSTGSGFYRHSQGGSYNWEE